MNRLTKEYYKELSKLPIIDPFIRSEAVELLTRLRANKGVAVSIKAPIKYILRNRISNLFPNSSCKDKLKPRKRDVPSSHYIATDCLRGYKRLVVEKQITDAMFELTQKKAAESALRAWERIKNNLCSPSLYRESYFGSPILIDDKSELNHVYFILDEPNDVVKIGVSVSPPQRLKQLVVGDSTLKIIHVIEKKGYPLEKELHSKFSQYNNTSIHPGVEWFDYSPEIKDYIINSRNN
jgi:hypothetical protein